jgi:small-conductance mechanosensitive channel
MNEDVEPALRKVESNVQGFFWLLPNLAIALLVFLVFLAAAWAANGTVASMARRRNRGDLGVLLGSFVRWAMIVVGLLVVATIIFHSVEPADALATPGIGSVAVGFAFKNILQNSLSGLFRLVVRFAQGQRHAHPGQGDRNDEADAGRGRRRPAVADAGGLVPRSD